MNKEKKLLRKILWFNNRAKFDIDFFDMLQPQRTVSEHHRYKSGLFYSEKCKRAIQYESNLELEFIKQLEQMKNVLFYYEQPVRIPYRRGRRRQYYTPDFGIYLKSREFVLVEMKNLQGMLEDRVQMKVEALLDFCSKRGFGLLLTDGRNTFDKLQKIRNNPKLEKQILKALDDDVLRKTQCHEILKRCGATQNQLLKVILRHNLKFRAYPFKLRHGNENKIFRQVFFEKKKYDDLIVEYMFSMFHPSTKK